MFAKLSALAFAAPLVAGLTLNIPSNPTAGSVVTITWTSQPSDPVFSLELTNPTFNADLAVANNVDPSLGQKTITIPPGTALRNDYTLAAVNISNINIIYSQTGQFAIGASTETSGAPASTASGSSATASGAAANSTSTASVVGVSQVSTSAFGQTVANSASGASASGTAPAGTGSGTSSSSSPTGSSTKLNGARSAFGSTTAVATSLLAVVVGAAALVL